MTTQPIRNRNDIESIKKLFLEENKIRDFALFVTGLNTALRISDLLLLKWNDVFDEEKNQFKKHIHLVEQKTHKELSVIVNSKVRNALEILKKQSEGKNGQFIFCQKKNPDTHITRIRAYQIIKFAAKRLGIEGNISCHSLRKTFGYHAWKIGTQPALIMNIYNHSNIEITKRYLGILQDDKDIVFQNINL